MEALTLKEIAKAVCGTLLYGTETISITNISTNSKEASAGTLFVPIIGEKADGHDYIGNAFENNAAAVFISHPVEPELFSETRGCIQVKDTKEALLSLSAYYRNRFTLPVIGVTGSVGKTTTKEMIAAALSTGKNVIKTVGNRNSQIGLPLTLFSIEKEHTAAVVEMGMSEFGEMERIATAARPDFAVITNIGVSHIGNLGSQENIRSEKLHIADAFHSKSILFLNDNDPLLHEIYEDIHSDSFSFSADRQTKEHLKEAKVISYGTTKDSIFCADHIHSSDGKTWFTLSYPDGTEEIELQVLGIHNVYNALAALAVSYVLGIYPDQAKKGLQSYSPIEMRGTIYQSHGVTFIDDTYNASPDSIKSGIQVLGSLDKAKRRIAVLADVWELGELSHDCHYDVGRYIAAYHIGHPSGIDLVVTVGKEAKTIAQAIQDIQNKEKFEQKFFSIQTESFLSNQEASSFLSTFLKQGDAVLVKGSRGMHTDEIIQTWKDSQPL